MTPASHTFQYSPMVGADVPLNDVLAATRAAGFTYTGLDAASIEAHLASGGSLDDIVETLGRLGLRVTDILHLAITADERANEQGAAAIAERAALFGAPWCLAAVPLPVDDAVLRRSLGTAAARISEGGSRLALEFCAHLHLRTLSQAADLCDDVGWDRCALVVDALHFFRAGPEWDVLARLHASQIAFVQLSDAARRPRRPLATESREHRILPGQGALPLRQFLDAISATGFDGFVVAEVLSSALRELDVRVGLQLLYDAMASTLDASASGPEGHRPS